MFRGKTVSVLHIHFFIYIFYIDNIEAPDGISRTVWLNLDLFLFFSWVLGALQEDNPRTGSYQKFSLFISGL